MNITKRGEYALRALIAICLAKEVGRDLVPISELAEHEHLPIRFIELILTQLKNAGSIDSKRGAELPRSLGILTEPGGILHCLSALQITSPNVGHGMVSPRLIRRRAWMVEEKVRVLAARPSA